MSAGGLIKGWIAKRTVDDRVSSFNLDDDPGGMGGTGLRPTGSGENGHQAGRVTGPEGSPEYF